METLKQYYNEVFQKRFPADEHPEFEKLDPAMIRALEKSYSFAIYKLNAATTDFVKIFTKLGFNANKMNEGLRNLAKALPTKNKPRY